LSSKVSILTCTACVEGRESERVRKRVHGLQVVQSKNAANFSRNFLRWRNTKLAGMLKAW